MVSIVVPVYNVTNYIERCLTSICAQTYQDLECILVDDKGTDDSMQKITRFIQSYNGTICFKIVVHSQNKGLSCARNTGLENATRKYVYFLDSDDSITPDCIEQLLNLMRQYPEADFVQGNILDEDSCYCKYSFHENVPEFVEGKEQISKYMLDVVTSSAWNRLLKRNFIIQNNLYFKERIAHEDMHWVYFLSQKVKAVAYCHKGTYLYSTVDGSIMTSKNKSSMIHRYSSRLSASADYMHDMKLNGSDIYRRRYACVNLTSCVVELMNLCSLKHWLLFWKYILGLSFSLIGKFTLIRFLFALSLMPPICFFAGHRAFKWRIQKYLINKI